MISGTVNASIEAIIPLVIEGPNSRQQVDAVIDTGFSGCLTLPSTIITALQLTWLCREQGFLLTGAWIFSMFIAPHRVLGWSGTSHRVAGGQHAATGWNGIDAMALAANLCLERRWRFYHALAVTKRS